MAVRLDAHYRFDVIEAKKQLKHGRRGGGNGDDKSHSKKRGRGQGDDRGPRGNKRARVDYGDEPCPLHGSDERPSSHKYRECTACPWLSNDKYNENACKKVLARPNIETDFPWYVKSCKKNRQLTPPSTRGGGDRGSGRYQRSGRNGGRRGQGDRGNNNNQGAEQQAQQQAPPQNQQFHFAPPPGMPPMPIGTTVQFMPPAAPTSGPVPTQVTSFAFGRQQQPAPATTQQASGGGRWVVNSQGAYQLV